MNVLITGAFGFVGSYLSNALKNQLGFHLIAVDIFLPKKHSYDEFYTWDDLDNICWKNIECIIHLAGKAHDTRNTTEADSYFKINTYLTQVIFKYFLQSNAKKFIFFSSVKAVADTVNEPELTESHTPNPRTPYGKSKLAAENYIINHPTPQHKKVYILRPSMIHGPGNKGNLNLLYKVVKKRLPWPLGKFANSRSFTSIDNLVFVIQELLLKNIPPGIYQISDDESIEINKLINIIARSIGQKPRIWNINKKLITTFAHFGDVLHLPLNSERLKKLTEPYTVSNSKIKAVLGVNEMPVKAEEGLQKTISSFTI